MSWSLLLLLPLLYAGVVLLVGDPAVNSGENEMAKHPTARFAYGKAAPSHTRFGWRVHVGILLVSAAAFFGLRGGVGGFLGWATAALAGVALLRVLFVAIKKPYRADL